MSVHLKKYGIFTFLIVKVKTYCCIAGGNVTVSGVGTTIGKEVVVLKSFIIWSCCSYDGVADGGEAT
jgi:hypothetical protein